MQKLLWVTCVLAAAACGGGGGSISVDNLPDELEGAQCDFLVACEGVEDRATCDASVIFDDMEFKTIQAGVEDGTITYDSGKAGACADSISGQGCSFAGFHDDNPCSDIFTGTVPAGGACFISLQCANNGDCVQTDQTCDDTIACCPGTCMGSFSESAVGGPCDDDLHFCSTNSFCKAAATSGPGVCTALLTMEGATCEDIDACANPMYCNLNFTTGMGTCKTAAASNATCSRTDLLPCADSRDYCDATTLKCVRSVAVGGTCAAGISCVDYASCINGVCTADIKLGGACVVDSGANCAGSLECVGGTCQAPPPGMACTLP